MKSNWGQLDSGSQLKGQSGSPQRSLRAEAKYLLVSNNQHKLKRAGRRRWGWLPGAGGGSWAHLCR